MGITVRGLSDVMRILEASAFEHPKKIRQATREAARNILAESKRKVPVDTGDLRRSAFVEYPTSDSAKITFNEDYAPFVEFGTGGLVEIPKGFEALASEFKGKKGRKVNRKAQPFLIPAFMAEKPKYLEKCEKILQNKA